MTNIAKYAIINSSSTLKHIFLTSETHSAKRRKEHTMTQAERELTELRAKVGELQRELEKEKAYSKSLEVEVVELKKSNAELKEISTVDGLTGIPNRRFFDEQFERELLEAKRRNEPLSVVMIDIDYFKKYNDFYGHQKGDDALRIVAQALKDSLHRPNDLVARYGGEEFVLILPNTDDTGSKIMAEIVRDKVEKLEIQHVQSETSDFVTLSLGVATLSSKEETVESLLKTADSNLYNAKKCGRNRVC